MAEKTIDQQLRDELAAKAAFYRVAADGYEAGRHNSVAMNWLRAAADFLDSFAGKVAAAVGQDIDISHFTSTPLEYVSQASVGVSADQAAAGLQRMGAPAFGQSYRCARCSELMPKPPEPHLYCVRCSRADADRLDELETNCWGLKAFAIPNTDGDEYGWKVVQQRTHGGRDAVIATEHSDDLRAAIDAASGIDRGDSSHV